MGRNMTIAGGAIVGALGLAVKSAVNFNKEMANVATLIPDSTERVIDLKESVQDLATETGKSTTDISGGLYQVISAFGDTADTAKILEVNVLAAAAGMATTTDSINLTSAVMKGYGNVSLAATKKVADLAFQTVKLGQTTFPELASSMGRAIPVAAKLGVSQEELFTGFATLTGVTGDATMVTTQLFAAMNSIMKPSADMKKSIKKLGYTSAETMVQELGLVGSMRALVKTTDGSVESVGKLVPNIRALPAVFALTGGQAEIFDEKLKKMKESAGAMPEAFREMSEGINASGFNMARLKEMMVVLTQRIGDSLAPAIGNLAVSVGKIVNEISDWIKEHPKLTQIIAKAALGIGALMTVLGPLMMMLPGLVVAFAALTSPIGLLIIAIAAITTKAILAIGTFKKFKKTLEDYEDAVVSSDKKMSGFEKTWASLTATIHKHVYGVDAAKFATEKYAEMTEEARKKQVELAKTTLDAIKETGLHTKAIDLLKSAFGFLIPEIKDTKDEKEGLNKGTKKLTETIAKLIPKIKDDRTATEKLKDEYWDLMAEVAKGEKSWQTFINQAIEIKGKIKALTDEFSDLAMAIEDDTEEWIDFGDTANTVLEDLGYGIGSIPEDVEDAATKTKSLWDEMADGLQTKWASTIGELLRGTTSLKDGLKGIWDTVLTQFTDMIGQMIAKWTVNFVGGIVSGATTAGTAASTLAGGAATLGTALEGLVAGVASILPAIATAIASAATILAAALPEILLVGAAAIALYAGFMAVNKLLGSGGSKAMDATNRELHNIWEESRNNFQNTSLMVGQLETLKKIGWSIEKILGTVKNKLAGGLGIKAVDIDFTPTNNFLLQIRANTALIREWTKRTYETLKVKSGGWAKGFEGVVTEPIRPLIGEAGPEYVSVKPLSEMKKSSLSSNVTVNNTVVLNGTVVTDREHTRNRIIPEMLLALESNFEKTKMKEILGIA